MLWSMQISKRKMKSSLDWQYCCGIRCTSVVLPCLLELHNLPIVDLLSHVTLQPLLSGL
uniref:Uncharacterized protein n=1 Tax=Arundo donax TaxID=35708 RepID=A0A0A9DAK5_ARUDO